jgi:hypothetical protein
MENNPSQIRTVILVTQHFDALRQLFVDLGLDVKSQDPSWAQVTPVLNSGRACLIVCESFFLSLEEAKEVSHSGPLYIQIENVSAAKLPLLISKYSAKRVTGGLYTRELITITPPGGGLVQILVN